MLTDIFRSREMCKSLLVLVLYLTIRDCSTSSDRDYDIYHLEDSAKQAEIEDVNVDELINTNEGFRNLTEHGVPQKRGIITAVSAGFSLLKGIASQIDVSRVCVVGLSNHGNRKLIEPTWYLHSGIIKDPLPREIAPGDAGVFTFEKTNYATFGTAGILTYTVEGTNDQIDVMWSVPLLYGPYSNRFNIEIGHNQTASETTYNALYNNNYQMVSNGGHWMHRDDDNIKIHAAMTNSAKASLLVEVYYNLPMPLKEIIGK